MITTYRRWNPLRRFSTYSGSSNHGQIRYFAASSELGADTKKSQKRRQKPIVGTVKPSACPIDPLISADVVRASQLLDSGEIEQHVIDVETAR